MKKLLLIDGHSILNRAFYGMPDLTNSAGVHTGAVYGFLNILFKFMEEEQPDLLAVVFDEHAPTFRHEYYAAYKGTRKPMPAELVEQVPLMRRVLTAMQVPVYSKPGLEADDILGTFAKKAAADGMSVSVISGDRDLLQIADDRICIRIPKTRQGQTVTESYHTADVVKAYGVTPLQFIDVKALMGDASDNIPGVPKVGEKTASGLIRQYGSLDGVYENLDQITKPALHKSLAEHEDDARMSKYLATIVTDADIDLDTDAAAVHDFYTPEAYSIFSELGFTAYLKRFDADRTASGNDTIQIIVPADSAAAEEAVRGICNGMESGTPAAFWPVAETGGSLAGCALASGGQYWFLDADRADIPSLLRQLRQTALALAGKDADRFDPILSVFGLKEAFRFLGIDRDTEFSDGIRLEGILDELVAAYLIDPVRNEYDIQTLAMEYCGRTLPMAEQLFGRTAPAAAFAGKADAVREYACRMAGAVLDTAAGLTARLKEYGMWELYTGMERKLSYILYDMQRLGIRIDPAALKEYSDALVGRINELDAAIHEAAGDPLFNIASPKQLGEILFEKLQLPYGKKTKTGYSTAADVLEKLAPEYPIVADILEYRGLTKLKSTYADGLMAYIGPDSRIHSTFHQTITATGRISSADPNLQNIPMKTELGKQIRKCFLPKEGFSFSDADYSQIELRILAHLSDDKALIKAYEENEDIHRITAAKVFHTPFEEVTPLQRRNAKAVNFGIIYGISSFGLSQDLSISRAEASEYIEAYFRTYPAVKAYLDAQVARTKELGYSTTLYGRRRPVPEISAGNFMTRQFGERIAMNSPIQGTAADIMKIAMIRVWERLRREKLQSELILQIHDELLIETAPGEEEKVAALLREEMQGAADLSVQLEVETGHGNDWYNTK